MMLDKNKTVEYLQERIRFSKTITSNLTGKLKSNNEGFIKALEVVLTDIQSGHFDEKPVAVRGVR